MNIKNLVKTDFQVVGGYTFISDLKKHLLNSGVVVIIEEGRFLGILVPYDLANKNHIHAIDCLRIKSYVHIDCLIEDVLEIMKREITNVLPVFDNNNIIGLIFKDDVLEFLYQNLKDTNVELEKAKLKAEEGNQLKSAFIANMSHEIRTPLNAIIGFSNALRRSNVKKEQRDKYIELITESGSRLMKLISDIIDISRIDARQMPINLGICNINSVIDNLCAQFKLSNKNKKLAIISKKPLHNRESEIETDELRLIQVLSNLVGNAEKFTSEGKILVGYHLEKNILHFYVKDTGIGISAEYQELIFGRFRQVNNDYTKTSSGTGLGLSIAKGLVELLHGEIWVDSIIGEGSTFHFTIPYLISKENKCQEIKGNKLLDEKTEVTLLIAEDEYINFMFLEDLFLNNGFNIIHAENGKEAIEIFRKVSSIDLILMDIKMPVMDGYEATIEIRKTDTTVPIIALTAHAMSEDRNKALEAGCNDYISKPLNEELLLNAIRKLVNNSNPN